MDPNSQCAQSHCDLKTSTAKQHQNGGLMNRTHDFSNSSIIHEEKAIKEITNVKEVWICDPNYHKMFALNFS